MAVKDGNGGYGFCAVDVVRHVYFSEPCADVQVLHMHVHWVFNRLRTRQPVEGKQ